jgi:hypothetical protein
MFEVRGSKFQNWTSNVDSEEILKIAYSAFERYPSSLTLALTFYSVAVNVAPPLEDGFVRISPVPSMLHLASARMNGVLGHDCQSPSYRLGNR